MIIKGVNQEAVVNFVVKKYDDLKTNRSVLEDLWMECFRAYHSQLGEEWDERAEEEGRSARFKAESFAAVESLNAQLSSLLLPRQNRWFGVDPVAPGKLPFDDQAAKQVEALLKGQTDRSKFPRHVGAGLRQLQIYGNCPVKVEFHETRIDDYPAYQEAIVKWENDHHGKWMAYQASLKEWQKQVDAARQSGGQEPPQPAMEMPEPPRAGEKKVVDRYPQLQIGDLFNFVVDPFSPDPDNPLIINHTWVSLAKLKRMSKPNRIGYAKYSNIDELIEKDRDFSDEEIAERFEALGLTVPDEQGIELHEMWGTFEIPGAFDDEDKNYLVGFNATVANGHTLICFEPTFLWSGKSPWFLARYRQPMPNEIYAIGQLEKALGEQDLINARANQNIDVVNHAIDPEYKAVDDDVIDLKLRSKPGRIRTVGDINNLVELRKNLNGLGISFQDLEMLKNDFQKLTLSTAPLSGQVKESATKTALDANSVSAEVTKIAMYIEDNFLREALQLYLEYDAQFITAAETVKLVQRQGTEFVDLSPEVIRQGWAVRVFGATELANRQERVQNILTFMQLVSGNPLLLPAVNIIELAKMVFLELGFSNTDQVFNDEATAAEVLSAMMEAGIIGGGANGQGAPGAGGDPATAQGQPGGGGAAGQDPVALARAIGDDLIGGSELGAQDGGAPGSSPGPG